MNLFSNKYWRRTLLSIALIIVLLLIALTVVSFFVVSQSGSRRISEFAISQLNQLENVALEAQTIEGNLFRGLRLSGVEITTDSVSASIKSMEASWNPYSLLYGSFILADLTIDSLFVTLKSGEEDSTNSTSDFINQFSYPNLPLPVSINNLRIDMVVINNAEQEFIAQSLSCSLTLREQNLELDQLTLTADPVFIQGRITAKLTPGIPLVSTLDWSYADSLFDIYDSASGTLSIEGDLNTLNIQHQLLTPVPVRSNGTVENLLAGAQAQIELSHNVASLELPFDALSQATINNLTVISKLGSGDIELELETEVVTSNLPEFRVSVTGSVLEQRMSIDSIEVSAAEDLLQGAAQIGWSDGIDVQANYQLNLRNPLTYLEVDLPLELTELSSIGDISYQWISETNQLVNLDMQSLAAQLGDYPLQGLGNISLVNERVQVNQLQLNTAANQLRLSGSFDENIVVDWEISAPELSQLSNQIQGSAVGFGTVRGAISSPEIISQFSFNDLKTGFVSVQSLDLEIEGANDNYIGQLEVLNGTYADDSITQAIEKLSLSLQGNLDQQQLSATIQSDIASLDLSVLGGPVIVDTQQWSGQLVEAQLDGLAGNWASTSRSVFDVSPMGVSLDESCWAHQDTSICLQLSSDQFDSFDLQANLQNYPLADFNLTDNTSISLLDNFLMVPRLPQGVTALGPASAEITAHTSGDDGLELDFSVLAENSLLIIESTSPDDFGSLAEDTLLNEQRYNWESLSATGSLRNNVWQVGGRAALDEQSINDTGIAVNGLLEANFTIEENSSVLGSATANFQDLGWIEVFLPQLSEVKGTLSSNLDISGSLEAPLLAGEVDISNGSFFATRLGVTFTELNSSIRGESIGIAELTGSVNSGDGRIAFEGSATDIYSSSRQISATLNGSDFKFIDIPDLSLSLSPNITLDASVENVHLAGTIDVPEFNLSVRELPTTAVNISRDVVVTNYPENRPDLERSISANEATLFDIPVTAELKLSLGEEVSFSGFGLEAQLAGSLDLQQLASGSNLTYGELDVTTGSYKLYGRTLTLRQGKLLFFGAYDNPALDIRAVREVDDTTVGVLMNGTLKNINSQLFSTPTLADNDIISVLITGRPFSQLGSGSGAADEAAILGAIAKLGLERGQGLTSQIRDRLGLDTLAITNTGDIDSSELTVGKYLTPEIFVRYGVGLFDNRSKMAVDYNFFNDFILQAESGEYQSIDITYRVEQ